MRAAEVQVALFKAGGGHGLGLGSGLGSQGLQWGACSINGLRPARKDGTRGRATNPLSQALVLSHALHKARPVLGGTFPSGSTAGARRLPQPRSRTGSWRDLGPERPRRRPPL